MAAAFAGRWEAANCLIIWEPGCAPPVWLPSLATADHLSPGARHPRSGPPLAAGGRCVQLAKRPAVVGLVPLEGEDVSVEPIKERRPSLLPIPAWRWILVAVVVLAAVAAGVTILVIIAGHTASLPR